MSCLQPSHQQTQHSILTSKQSILFFTVLTARSAFNESVPSYLIKKHAVPGKKNETKLRFHSTCKKWGIKRKGSNQVCTTRFIINFTHKKRHYIYIYICNPHTFYRKANGEEMEEIRHKLEGCKAPRLLNYPLILPAQSQQPASCEPSCLWPHSVFRQYSSACNDPTLCASLSGAVDTAAAQIATLKDSWDSNSYYNNIHV